MLHNNMKMCISIYNTQIYFFNCWKIKQQRRQDSKQRRGFNFKWHGHEELTKCDLDQ